MFSSWDSVKLFNAINRRQVFYLVLLTLLVNTFEILGLSLFIPIIDLFQSKGGNVTAATTFISNVVVYIGLSPTLPVFLLLLCVMFLVKAVLTMWMRYVSVRMASDLQDRVRCMLFQSFVGSYVSFIHGQRQGTLLSVLGEHTSQVGQGFFLFVQVVAQWITVLAYMIFVFLVSWQLSLVALLLGLSMYPVIRWIGKKAYQYGEQSTFAVEAAQHSALEALQAKKLVNAMNWGIPVNNCYRACSAAVRDAWQWMAFWSNSPGIVLQPLSVMILSILILLSVRYELSIALLGAFVMAFLRLLPTVQSVLTMGSGIHACRPGIDRVQEMLDQSLKQQEPSGSAPFPFLKSCVRLSSVHFHYDAGVSVLNDLTLEISRGSTVGIVGSSGSGKTTVADLLTGLYKPTSGHVFVDGVDLNDLDIKQYRSKIAYVPQDAFLFHDTIRNNLTLGLERDVLTEELREACEQAGAWGFVIQRKDGLDTVLGDRGIQLSGGQRQRLAMARALLRKPDFLILDEATSALDHESERGIRHALEQLRASGKVTVLIIAHRFTTIQHVDCIYQIKHGHALKLGSWKQAKEALLAAGQDLELA